MSWFKKTPRLREPLKHLPHHRASPMSERFLKETKERTTPKLPDNLTDKKTGDKDERS